MSRMKVPGFIVKEEKLELYLEEECNWPVVGKRRCICAQLEGGLAHEKC